MSAVNGMAYVPHPFDLAIGGPNFELGNISITLVSMV